MTSKLELTGNIFGRLTVLKESPIRDSQRAVKWICRCECGKVVNITGKNLVNGGSTSCGCLRTESTTTHGLSNHPLYNVWKSMNARCNNPKTSSYKDYGGRGIKVCHRWSKSIANFIEDMEKGYKKGLQLDRIDNDKGYSKDNCRWVTRSQNLMNKRSYKDSTSKYKGVYWRKRSGKWEAGIRKNNKYYYLGSFACEKEAALAYNKKTLELFGEFSHLNKILN